MVGPARAGWVATHFGVREEGNVPAELDPQNEFTGKTNILAQRQSIAATAQSQNLDPETLNLQLIEVLEHLRLARARPPRPHLDHKIITSWNGLMISALAQAHVMLERATVGGQTRYLDAALAAATFLQRHLYDPARGVLYRTYGTARGESEGFAEDYAGLIAGLPISTRPPMTKHGCGGPRSCRPPWTNVSGMRTGVDTSRPRRPTPIWCCA